MAQATTVMLDVQGSLDVRRLPIDKVGIKDIRHPIIIRNRDGTLQPTVGRFNLFVHLPHDRRGTHMSRFVEILNKHEQPFSFKAIKTLLQQISAALESNAVHMEVNFPYFITKRAPISGVSSLLDYDVTLMGKLQEQDIATTIKVVVPITSLCPCSKQISDYGAHNQRAHVTLSVRINEQLWIDDLIDVVEDEASCEIYGLIKRPDEKFITERAYDNPKFVEDLVRDIAVRLNADPRVLAYTLESENFESIHNHSAYACIEVDKTASPNI